jgi:CheY-like chemotaxis protein
MKGAPLILVVEDRALIRSMIQRVLEDLGYDVAGAADGLEAVQQMETAVFDAVLMDCQMPRLDGFRATAIIRRRERGGATHTPIIGVSGRCMEGDHETALARGMDAYVTKPITTRGLQSVLDRFVPRPPQSG